MSNIQIFNYESSKDVRVIEQNGEPWFVAKDVCEILGMTVEATRRLDDDEKGLTNIQTPGGNHRLHISNRSRNNVF